MPSSSYQFLSILIMGNIRKKRENGINYNLGTITPGLLMLYVYALKDN